MKKSSQQPGNKSGCDRENTPLNEGGNILSSYASSTQTPGHSAYSSTNLSGFSSLNSSSASSDINSSREDAERDSSGITATTSNNSLIQLSSCASFNSPSIVTRRLNFDKANSPQTFSDPRGFVEHDSLLIKGRTNQVTDITRSAQSASDVRANPISRKVPPLNFDKINISQSLSTLTSSNDLRNSIRQPILQRENYTTSTSNNNSISPYQQISTVRVENRNIKPDLHRCRSEALPICDNDPSLTLEQNIIKSFLAACSKGELDKAKDALHLAKEHLSIKILLEREKYLCFLLAARSNNVDILSFLFEKAKECELDEQKIANFIFKANNLSLWVSALQKAKTPCTQLVFKKLEPQSKAKLLSSSLSDAGPRSHRGTKHFIFSELSELYSTTVNLPSEVAPETIVTNTNLSLNQKAWLFSKLPSEVNINSYSEELGRRVAKLRVLKSCEIDFSNPANYQELLTIFTLNKSQDYTGIFCFNPLISTDTQSLVFSFLCGMRLINVEPIKSIAKPKPVNENQICSSSTNQPVIEAWRLRLQAKKINSDKTPRNEFSGVMPKSYIPPAKNPRTNVFNLAQAKKELELQNNSQDNNRQL